MNRMRLVNYRNYKDISPIFSPNINILYGNNGQGKTNLLEAVFLMLRGYSHRASSKKELITFDEQAMFCVAEIHSRQINHTISLKVADKRRGWKLDGKAESSFSKIQKLTGCILFEPDDLDIVKSSPESRRRFLNMEISGLIPSYRPYLREFERVRHQRNAILKQARINNQPFSELMGVLQPWDNQLVQSAARIFSYRQKYLDELKTGAEKIYGDMAGINEVLSLRYQTNVFYDGFPDSLEEIKAVYQRGLENELQNDLERGYTKLGPHNDELSIRINHRPARYFASQGQQRTAAISLKLAHIDLYQKILKIKPVVLLDDILSELDFSRQKNILSVLDKAQTFITCTDPSFSAHLSKDIKKIRIENGNLIQ